MAKIVISVTSQETKKDHGEKSSKRTFKPFLTPTQQSARWKILFLQIKLGLEASFGSKGYFFSQKPQF